MSTTTTVELETTTSARVERVSLLELGIDALRHEAIPQCRHHLAGLGGMRCAEGVLADQLIAAYPERFRWGAGRSYGLELLDRDPPAQRHLEPGMRTPERHVSLTPALWRLLDPLGEFVQERVYARQGMGVTALNDSRRWSLAEIGEELATCLDEARLSCSAR